MPSAMFEAYAANLRRFRQAGHIDEKLQAQHSWQQNSPYLITERTRQEAQGLLQILKMKKGRSG